MCVSADCLSDVYHTGLEHPPARGGGQAQRYSHVDGGDPCHPHRRDSRLPMDMGLLLASSRPAVGPPHAVHGHNGQDRGEEGEGMHREGAAEGSSRGGCSARPGEGDDGYPTVKATKCRDR